jgi:hypothetical protein
MLTVSSSNFPKSNSLAARDFGSCFQRLKDDGHIDIERCQRPSNESIHGLSLIAHRDRAATSLDAFRNKIYKAKLVFARRVVFGKMTDGGAGDDTENAFQEDFVNPKMG